MIKSTDILLCLKSGHEVYNVTNWMQHVQQNQEITKFEVAQSITTSSPQQVSSESVV